MAHEHWIEDEDGELVETVAFCSDGCHRAWCADNGEEYGGWSGCHELETDEWCQHCGVRISVASDGSCDWTCLPTMVGLVAYRGEDKCEHGVRGQLPIGRNAPDPAELPTAEDVAERILAMSGATDDETDDFNGRADAAPDEWFCNDCSTYFPVQRGESDRCPTCGAGIDPVSGVAKRA